MSLFVLCVCGTAQMELYSNRLSDVARKVLEVGRKKYPDSVSYAMAALDLTIPTADDSSTWQWARVVVAGSCAVNFSCSSLVA